MGQGKGISVRQAAFGYKRQGGPFTVIKGMDLELHPGEFIGLAGANGVGKSTFLKTLCGLLPLINGNVAIDGTEIGKLSLQELAKKVSIVLSEKIGGFNLTVHDVVTSGRMPYTDSFNNLDEAGRDIVEEAIALCGLKEHTHKLMNELSDGLFQKTVIAKAIAQQTPIMLLDEPSAFLDYASKHELFLQLKKLAAENNKCILASSHDLDLVLKYCSKVLVLSGESYELIPAQVALQHETFKKLGGGFL